MNWSYDTLDELLDLVWIALADGGAQAEHPFHVAALATHRTDGASVRAMILRRADVCTRQLTCSTDLRAAKTTELNACPGAEWMFYDSRTSVQVRARGHTMIHQEDAQARAAWESTPMLVRAHYASPHVPGSPLPESTLERLGGMVQQAAALAGTDAGWRHFGLIATTVDTLDWLQIAKTGPRHAGFNWKEGRFQGQWLA